MKKTLIILLIACAAGANAQPVANCNPLPADGTHFEAGHQAFDPEKETVIGCTKVFVKRACLRRADKCNIGKAHLNLQALEKELLKHGKYPWYYNNRQTGLKPNKGSSDPNL